MTSRRIPILVILGSLFGVLVMGMATAAYPSGDSGPADFSGGCDTTQTSGNLEISQLGSYNRLLIQAPERLQATTDPSWGVGCAIRVEVHEGDVDPISTDRAEFAGNTVSWKKGEDVWYAMSFMLDPSSPLPQPGQWMLVDQFFAQDMAERISGGSPPLSIEVTPTGQARIYVRGGVKKSATALAPRESSYFLTLASPGTWHELLFHVKWSTEADGLVEVWQRKPDGSFTNTPQVLASGPNVLTVAGDALPAYAETGIYRSRSAAAQVVYYGGLWARPARAEAEAFFPSSSSQSNTSRTTSTALSCSPQAISVGHSTFCTATVTNTAAEPISIPSGQIRFSSSSPYGQFSDEGLCALVQIPQSSSSSCTLSYTPRIQPGSEARNDLISAIYFPNDNVHAGSNVSITMSVSAVPTKSTTEEPDSEQTGSPSQTPSTSPLDPSSPSTIFQSSPAPHLVSSVPSAPDIARRTQSDLITSDAAIAHAVKLSVRRLRFMGLRATDDRLLRNLVIASTMVALEPGHYYDSFKVTAALGRSRAVVLRDRLRGVISRRPLIATGRLTVASAGRYRFEMRLTSLGCSVLRQAKRDGLDLHFSNFLSVDPDRGPSAKHAFPLSIRF